MGCERALNENLGDLTSSLGPCYSLDLEQALFFFSQL